MIQTFTLHGINVTKKSDILDGAQILFSQFGLKRVTTDDIAREARVSKATIYRHFQNKTDIFGEVVDIEADQLLSAIREAVDQESTCVGKLKAHLLTKMSKIQELINFYKVTQNTSDNFWPFIAEARDRSITAEKEIVREIIEYGNRTGELNVENPGLVSSMMVVSLKSQELDWATEGHDDISLEDYVDMMLGVMMHGIAAR